MNKKILLFGSSGFLGLELVQKLITLKYELVTPTRNIINAFIPYNSLLNYVKYESPDFIINCAAITGLDNCFLNQDIALEVNSFFNIKLASICLQANIRFLGISTDNVFSCVNPCESHTEIDYCEPLTWYGKTKFYGEVKTNNSSLLHTLRLPMLFSPKNKSHVICKLIQKAMNGENVKVSVDAFNTPILTEHAVNWIVEWIQDKYLVNPENITHLYADKYTSIYDLIDSILIKLGSVNIIQKALASEFISQEKKPLWGGLHSKYTKPLSLSESIDFFVREY